MEMQGVPVCKEFHEGCPVGRRRQMSSMQTHGAQAYPLRSDLTHKQSRFHQSFSDVLISLTDYVPQTLEMRISIGCNKGERL